VPWPLEVVCIAAGLGIGFLLGRLARAAGEPALAAAPVSGPAPAGQPKAPDSQAEVVRIVDVLGIGVVFLDGRGTIALVNDAARTIFRIKNPNAVGRSVIEVVPSFELDQRVREALAGSSWRGSISLAGTAPVRRLTVAVVPLAERAGAAILASDETRLHELERTRSEFISNVSHELRTPLSSIKLMIETLLASDDQEARELFLPQVHKEVERMVRLVEELLELARAESGRVILKRERLDLAELVESVVRSFEGRAQTLGIHLHFEGSRAPLDGDPQRLTQVAINLIDNALRHTQAGGEIEVSVRPVAPDVLLVVRDTGIGIPYNDLPHIFDRFYVVERSRARESAGTGLGLAIVRQFVEAHDGRVTADSELGVGSTFHCSFPAGVEVTPSPGAAARGGGTKN
jgi:two-component system phosphate regulon sensor histidine kinase PhoR